MSSEFKTYKLNQVGRIITGKTPSSKIVDAFGLDTPFITPKDMDGRKWIDSTERYLSKTGVNTVKSSLVPPKSVAVSCIGSDMGKVIMVKHNSVTNQQINTIVVDDERFNPEYIYYELSLRQEELKSIASGSATPILNKSHFANVEIRIPSKEAQDKIVNILDSLDEKKELNRQINQTLEQIAKSIFKSWFVDFDPVKAKIVAKEKGQDAERAAMLIISGKTKDELEQLSPVQLKKLAETSALFPDELVESELGDIPKGWEVFTIDDIAETVAMGPFGSNIKVSTFVNEGIPIISGKHLKGTLLEDIEFDFISKEHAKKLGRSNVLRGDVIFTHAGSIGQVAYIPDGSKYDHYILSQRQYYMRPNKRKISPIFIVYYFRSNEGQRNLLADTSQVGVPSISRPVTNLKRIKLVLPKTSIPNKFDKIIRTFHGTISKNTNQSYTLDKIKNSLLPQLLSGKINLDNINIMVKE